MHHQKKLRSSLILLQNCNLISMDPQLAKIEYGIDVLIKNQKIAKIAHKIASKGAKIIDCTNRYIVPGYINGHTHIPMSLFRNTNEGYNLQDWLAKAIWPIENKMNDEDIYTFSLLSFYESLLNGVTTVHDMYFRTDVIIKARQAAQINLMTTVTLMDADGKIAGEKRLANFATIVRRYPQELFSVGLHGLYTCSLPYIKKCLAKAKQLNYQLIHLHFCENDQEVRDIKRRFLVKNPSDVLVKYFKSFQLVLAHCVCLNTTDYLNLQKLNVSVVHNPISNAQLGCGFADIVKLIQHKINVCIGTDGQGSGVNLNVIEAVKYAVLIAKSLHKNPCVLDAYDALKLITINAAQALGLSACKGSISVGKDADLVIYQFQNLQMYPINDPIADIVYNSTSADIQSVFVNGKMVINQQKHLTINRDKLLKKCEKLQTILLHKSHSK